MPAAQARVAEVFLDHPEEAIRSPIADLAGRARCGEASVIRFCRTIGFDNLTKPLVLQAKCFKMRFGNVDANGMFYHLRQSYSCHAWLKHAYPFRPLVKTTVDQTHTRSL